MAIRLQSEFADIKGLVYQVNIHDSSYAGSVISFVIGGDGFVLNYEGDVNDRYKPIIGSFVEFSLIEQNENHSNFLTDLITAQEGRFLVSIRLDPDGVNTLYWAGVVLPEQMRLADEAYPIENRIRAADDLANLTNVLYNNNGNAYTNADGMTFAKHLTLALTKMRTASLWASNTPFLRAVASYTPGNIYTGDYYSNLRVTHTTFYNEREDNFENQYFSCHEILRQFAVPLGARIYQANGYYWFVPVCKAVDSATVSALNYDKEGDYLSTSSVNTEITIGTDINKMKGWSYGYQLPLKKVRRSWLHKGTYPVFAGSWNSATLGSTVVSGGEFEYASGTVFNLQVLCGYQVTGTVTPTAPGGGAIIFQRRVKLRVKVGTYYLKNTTTNTLQFFPDGLTYGEYTAPVEQSISWTTNSADRYTLSYEPQRYNPNDPTLNILLRTVTLPQLPVDLQDIEVTAYFEAYETNNTLNAAETAAASPTVTVKLDFQNNDKDFVVYAATSTNDNVTVVDQGEYLIGDAVQTPSFGRIMVKDSSSSWADPTTWTSPALTTGTQDLHTLGVREILFGQSTPRLRQQGQAHLPTQFTVPQMYSTFSYDGRRYALYSMNYMAKDRIQELDMYELYASTAGTTAAEESDGRNNPTRDDIAEVGSPKTMAVSNNLINAFREINDTSATVTGIGTRVELLYDTFQPKGVDYAKTVITYESNKTDGTALELDQTSAQLKSASGNSLMAISEASPGEFRIDLQDDTTPTPLSINVAFATADKTKAGLFGLGTEAPEERLHVLGNAKVDGNVIVTGTVDGRDVATDGTKLDGIASGAEVNQNAFSNVAVTGQTTVAADGKTDTLNFAAADTNLTITTDATTDTVTFGIATNLALSSVSTTGTVFALGSITGSSLTIGNVISSGDITANSATLGNLYFTGGGTTTIGPNNTLPTDPADLEIRTNGNCDVVLDYDDNESSQAFRVKDGDGNVMFSVDEDGISVANGTTSTGAVLRLGEATANGTNYVAVQAPASLAANTTYTLPSTDGTSGQVLSTNGTGTLSFVTRKATQVTGKTVATGAWSLVSGYYEASISDAAISATSIVDVIPDNASAATAATAGVLPRTDSSSGAVKIYATTTPAATLTVTLNIFNL